MARFNFKSQKTKTHKTTNYAGGAAYATSDKYHLVSLALTSFLTNQVYRTSNKQLELIQLLVDEIDPKFVAQTALFTRNEMGMRSVSHVLAGLLAVKVSGKDWAKHFYNKIVVRPDDMLEIYAAFQAFGGKKLTNAMKKGFAAAFDRFDGYQLAKYRGEKHAIKLVDMVNLVHPTPTLKNAKALQDLVAGTLRNIDTWEAKMSAIGQKGLSENGLKREKRKVWTLLIKEGKLGYFALIRNLRNIVVDAPGLVPVICNQLIDPKRIKHSRILPFRLYSAFKALKRSGFDRADIERSLIRAMYIACENLPNFEKSLVVVDNSGSMAQPVAGSKDLHCNEVGALMGYALAQRSKADIMEFGTKARLIKVKPSTSALSFAESFEQKNRVGHGTNFHSIFDALEQKVYKHIFIFSDMQGWMGGNTPDQAYQRYKKRSGANPIIYSFDLAGYGSLQFPEQKVRTLAGFNPKIFEVLPLFDGSPAALIKRMEQVEW